MKHIRKPRNYWTKEKCHCEALKYKTKRMFKEYSGSAYYHANKNQWIDEICTHMILKNKPRYYWNKIKCQEEAFKYTNRNNFCLFSSGAYRAALNNNWLDDICGHMETFGNRMFRCIYVYEFSDNSVYIGLTHDIKERNSYRKNQNNDAVTKHIKKTGLSPNLKQLCEYIHVDAATVIENDMIETYKSLGWNVLNKNRGGVIGGTYLLWTYEKCKKEALKYKTFSEFKKKSDAAYRSAKKHGWFDEITKHIKSKITKWIVDDVRTEALKYNGRYEFNKNNLAAYTWALRQGILDEICSHMPIKNRK